MGFEDKHLRTYALDDIYKEDDWTKHHPWRYPGSAPVEDACGISGGWYSTSESSPTHAQMSGWGVPQGEKGSNSSFDAPLIYRTQWVAGSQVEVAWGIQANHGGGYQYRLCPANEEPTEECFQRTPLPFAGKTHKLRFDNGTEVEIPATYATEGVEPAGSMWAKLPIPACDDATGGFQEKGCAKPQFAPPPGCDETCWGYQNNPAIKRYMPDIVDHLQLPSGLTGDYVLGWRWDVEGTTQIWASCADVQIN